MTSKDADCLSVGLKIAKTLRKLSIRNSLIDDDKFYAIYDGLKNNDNLSMYNVVCVNYTFLRVWLQCRRSFQEFSTFPTTA